VFSSLCRHAGAYTPAELWDAFVARFSQSDGLPRFDVGSASAITVSRPQWRSLAFRPVDSRSCQRSPFHRRLSWTCHLLHDSDCYWPERPLPGGTYFPLRTEHLSRRTSKIEGPRVRTMRRCVENAVRVAELLKGGSAAVNRCRNYTLVHYVCQEDFLCQRGKKG